MTIMANHKKKQKLRFKILNVKRDLKDLRAGKLVHTSVKMETVRAYVEARGM